MQFHDAVLQGLHQRWLDHRSLPTLPSRPGCCGNLQIAQLKILVGILIHPLQSLECPCWCRCVVQELVKVDHSGRSGSPPALQEGPQLQPSVDHSVNGCLLSVLHLLFGDPPARLLPFSFEGVGQDAGWLVSAHANKH